MVSKKTIRVKFVDQCWDQVGECNYLYPYLTRRWNVELVERDPEYVFCSCFGREHLRYDCVKVFFSGENLAPDFNSYDYAIGSDWIAFGDRYLRVPLYAFYPAWRKLIRLNERDRQGILDRKFCSFVVSNDRADPIRDRFFRRLSEYKPVDSGGRHLNNVGGPVADKIEFCSRYKFNIAFENSAYPGYTTEKIMEPLSVGSVPIYWGNPEIGREFNLDCMVRVRDESDIERAVEEIVRLDQDDVAYLAKCRAPLFAENGFVDYDRVIDGFLAAIIDQPIEKARRLARTGLQPNVRSYERHAHRVYDFLRKLVPLKI